MPRLSIDDPWPDLVEGSDIQLRSARGGLITAAVQGVRVVLMIASQVLLARFLTPAEFGLVAMVAPVIGFVQVMADLGITQALIAAPKLTVRQINSFFWANAAMSVVLAALAAASAPLIGLFYGEPRLVPVVLACAGLILVSGVGLVHAALINRQLRFVTIAAIDVTALLLSVVAGVAAAAAGLGYWSLVLSQGVFGVVSTTLVLTVSSWRLHRPGWDPSALALVRFGGAVTAANLVNYVNVSLDKVIVGRRLGVTDLGLYDRAWKLAVQPIAQIQSPFNRIALPTLARLLDTPDAYRNAFLRMLQVMMALSTPAMVTAALLSEELVVLALGQRWAVIAPLVTWMSFSGVAMPIVLSTFWLLITQSRVGEQIRLSAATAGMNMTAYVVGVQFGLYWMVALSVLSVYLLQLPLLVGTAVRTGPVRLFDVAPVIAANAAAAVAAILAVLAVRTGVDGLALFLAAPVAAVLASSLALFGLPPSRRHMLAGLRLVAAALRRSRPEQPAMSDAV